MNFLRSAVTRGRRFILQQYFYLCVTNMPFFPPPQSTLMIPKSNRLHEVKQKGNAGDPLSPPPGFRGDFSCAGCMSRHVAGLSPGKVQTCTSACGTAGLPAGPDGKCPCVCPAHVGDGKALALPLPVPPVKSSLPGSSLFPGSCLILPAQF